MSEIYEQPHRIVRKDSIEELCNHRDRAFKLASQAFELIVEAERAARAAAPSEQHAGFLYGLGKEIEHLRYYVLAEDEDDSFLLEKLKERARAKIDRHAWTSLVNISGLRNMMDAEGKQKYNDDIEAHVPAFTLENCVATFASVSAQSGEIFERGVINVFKCFYKKQYKTNSAFGIGKRAVMKGVFHSYGAFSLYGQGRDFLIDIDRIFHILDGQKPPESSCLADTISAARQNGISRFETKYFDGRIFFGNGNVHLRFLRSDLINRVNEIIARHYGKSVPDNTKDC